MRKILFKAKRTGNGEWVYGYYQQRHVISGQKRHLIFWSNTYTVWEYVDIDPETLCQYTGLTDKNGKKIWENDIVKHEISSGLGQVIWYQEDYIGWIVDDIWIDGQQYSHEMFSECEVIGNIFDTPELLKETNTLEKILEEVEEAIEEAMIQEDAPIYCGNMKVDGYIRASVVKDIIRKHIKDPGVVN